MSDPEFNFLPEEFDANDSDFDMDIPDGGSVLDDEEDEEHGPDSTIVEKRSVIPLLFQSIYTNAVTTEDGGIRRLEVSDEYCNQGYPSMIAVGNAVSVQPDTRKAMGLLFEGIPLDADATVTQIMLPGPTDDPLACIEVAFDIFHNAPEHTRSTHSPKYWFRPDQLKV